MVALLNLAALYLGCRLEIDARLFLALSGTEAKDAALAGMDAALAVLGPISKPVSDRALLDRVKGAFGLVCRLAAVLVVQTGWVSVFLQGSSLETIETPLTSD